MNKKIGNKLQEARINQSLTIQKISEETFIRKHFLIALEEGDFSQLPSAAQVRGFLGTYADYLGLDSKEILDSLKQKPKDNSITKENNQVKKEEINNQINKTKEMETIFKEIGESIKIRRELLGLSLEEIENHTHIPTNYLQLVESGSFNQFPSPTQARGMLGNYSKFLDMDEHSVMLRYADALQSKLKFNQELNKPKNIKSQKDPKQKFQMPLWLRNTLSADTFVFGVLGVATIIFSIWGISHVLDIQSNTVPKPTAPALSGLLLPSATTEILITETTAVGDEIIPANPGTDPDGSIATPTLQAFVGENIEIYIIVHERTYLRVIVDGEIKFDGRAIPGSNMPFTAFQRLEILTGDGSAFQIFFNGDDLGPLGIKGEVVNVVYTRNGLIVPTPTATPTIDPNLITPSPTPTLILTEEPTN